MRGRPAVGAITGGGSGSASSSAAAACAQSSQWGFWDVPARFVAAQLNALAGLAVLRRVAAHHPAPNDPDNTALIGLLRLPAFERNEPVRGVRRGAAGDERVTLNGYWALETREIGYESPAAVVYARHAGRFKLRLHEGQTVWVDAQSGMLTPYAEPPLGQLTYLNRYWSGFLWPEPGAGLPQRAALSRADRGEYPVVVHESRELGGRVWVRVDWLSHNLCGGTPIRRSRVGCLATARVAKPWSGSIRAVAEGQRTSENSPKATFGVLSMSA